MPERSPHLLEGPGALPPCPLRVLLAEDHEDLREIFARVMRFDGYEVETAADGQEALELFGESRFDALVCELRLPRLSGAELVVRARRLHPKLIVIILTGLATRGLLADIRGLGADEVLVKPLPTLRDLGAAIARAWEQRSGGPPRGWALDKPAPQS